MNGERRHVHLAEVLGVCTRPAAQGRHSASKRHAPRQRSAVPNAGAGFDLIATERNRHGYASDPTLRPVSHAVIATECAVAPAPTRRRRTSARTMHPAAGMRDLRGATALITGSAKRIGRAIALSLAREGANVVVHYRSAVEEAQDLVQELTRLGVRAWALRADFRKINELNGVVDRAVELADSVQILINNASAFPRNTFETVTREELIASIETDAWAPFELARRFARQADAGHIVNLLDTRIAARFDWQHFAYCAAKDLFGLFTRLMAIHLAPRVAVNVVAPGLILPPEGKGPEYLEELKSELPLQRIGDPAFVAEAVVFLVKSEFITGQTIFVDGGRHLLGGSRG